MQYKKLYWAMAMFSMPLYAVSESQLQHEINRLERQSVSMQQQIQNLKSQLEAEHEVRVRPKKVIAHKKARVKKVRPSKDVNYHSHVLFVHTPVDQHDPIGFYPTAIFAGDQVIAYIAGTPIVSSPYLGSRPAFDGSDYIVNISSINRDVRLMEQRRRMYHAYAELGNPVPNLPIISISGKVEPVGTIGRPYVGRTGFDLDLGSSELDVSAALNENVEAYIALSYDSSPPEMGGPRVFNSQFDLSLGFVNIGNLDKTPFYFTAGQLYAPFGRYASAMVSAPLTMRLARTWTRPFILGYKSQEATGPFAAVYGFVSDTTLGSSGVGGVNLGYTFARGDARGEIGAGFLSSLNESTGMQNTGVPINTVFGGFASWTNGNERVKKIPAANVHGNLNIDRYNFTAEWVGATESFRVQDLSFNARPARPQALQFEAGMTFVAFDRPSSIGVGYQWSKDALALQLPQQRIAGVFNISIWRNTVESLEFRHDIDYRLGTFANGAAPVGLVNPPVIATGSSANTLLAQIGVYF